MTTNTELNFEPDEEGSEKGYNQWVAARKKSMQDLGVKLGLPLDHVVEVRLISGIELRGRLRLQEERLFLDVKRDLDLELEVDGVVFKMREIESCARVERGE